LILCRPTDSIWSHTIVLKRQRRIARVVHRRNHEVEIGWSFR
jgi:hypothetical protein